MQFRLEPTSPASKARAGILTLSHGEVPTPIFMPVGTVGSVKSLSQEDLEELVQAPIILSNTYHLFLRPGTEDLTHAGGIHGFMNWKRPVLTDSGGYQVYSLAQNRKITEEGVSFRSHIDGSLHMFTPESVVEAQRAIGSDIMMVLDECPPIPCTPEYARKSMDLTFRWAQRCKETFASGKALYGYEQVLFPIVQGGIFPELRRHSAELTASLDMPGNAIGGLSVGETEAELYEMTALACSILPLNKPRYLMGVGTPVNILTAIGLGVDMFDCVLPSRNARHGMLFTWKGIINIRNAKYKTDFSPIDPDSELETDLRYSKAYLRHLFVCNELLALRLATLHNLHFYLDLVTTARNHILEGDFDGWKEKVLPDLGKRI